MASVPECVREVKTPVLPRDDDEDIADLPWESERPYTQAMMRTDRGNYVVPIELARFIAARRI